MDALGDWFFWAWKIGLNSTVTDNVAAPLWSVYQLWLQNGWVPTRTRSGHRHVRVARREPVALRGWRG